MPLDMDIIIAGPDPEIADKMRQVIEVFGQLLSECQTKETLNLLGMAISLAGVGVSSGRVGQLKEMLNAIFEELEVK